MEDISPEAYNDAAVLANDAPKSLVPLSVIEMHLFSYLGCLLALYKGHAVGDWGYQYSLTSEGFPFSAQFEDARRLLVDNGLVGMDESGLLSPIQPNLQIEINTLLGIGLQTERRRWLRTAVECGLALPVGSIRYAISQSPGISTPLRLKQRKKLLDFDDLDLLYDEFKLVSSALGTDDHDVLSPAVIWLSARVLRVEENGLGN